MNADFVCVKVDREERPALDAVYMTATVALTGHGGWPMTRFLTPDGRPFFCGTYYPKPAFTELLSAVTRTWRTRRDEVEKAGDQIASELRRLSAGLPGGGPAIEPSLCDAAGVAVPAAADNERGGGVGGPQRSPPPPRGGAPRPPARRARPRS